MAKETALWSWLSKARLTMREHIDLRRVEDAMGAGFPDVDGYMRGGWLPTQSDGFPFKLELKSEVRPARAATPIRFKVQKRTAQLEFMRRRYDMGESAYFLLQVGEASERRLFLAPGDIGADLKRGVNEAELALLCVNEGQIFDSKVKPHQVIERIRACSLRRYFR